MHGKVLDLSEPLQIGKGKLNRPLDQASYFQPEALESAFRKTFPVAPGRQFPFGQK
jgi:hypothetical protein